jgi:hypothetical protein
MLRKLLICAAVVAVSVPSSGCLVVGAAVIVSAKKKEEQRICERVARGEQVDPRKLPRRCRPGEGQTVATPEG